MVGFIESTALAIQTLAVAGLSQKARGIIFMTKYKQVKRGIVWKLTCWIAKQIAYQFTIPENVKVKSAKSTSWQTKAESSSRQWRLAAKASDMPQNIKDAITVYKQLTRVSKTQATQDIANVVQSFGPGYSSANLVTIALQNLRKDQQHD